MIANSPGLGSFFVRELGSWWNKYVYNDVDIWDALYRRSYARKLESSDQRGRHYIVAGIIRDLIAPGGRVLDAGCGCGTTYGMLRGLGYRYRGIDVSEEAIDRCLAAFGDDSDARFEQADIATYEDDTRYDAIILNEVLYYLPYLQARNVATRFSRLLRPPEGTLIVSMSQAWKSRLYWRACASLTPPTRSVALRGTTLGSSWKIRVYQPFLPPAPKPAVPLLRLLDTAGPR
jgi:2-polyprenyl-3-methyl-5-hydroxy-6-metoxy-1,4-benzoquinol methylase